MWGRCINGMPGHVHLLIEWRTDESLSTLIRKIKAHSSRWIHESFPDCRSFAWQEGYSVFTVSPSQFDSVDRYVRDQREHHRSRSFDDALREMPWAHGNEFDERFLLG